uniref:interleukin-6 receptor subunit alpha n=1 Tax=Jaculus jaculus TaxID=51337 RepID=UPI001E1B481F|nr:interleukin-6 receptor subunit alpha [Jaculus jaculus]
MVLRGVSSDVLRSPPGASVNLTCPGREPADNATVHWVLSGSHRRRWSGVGRTLPLRSVQFSDSGNYSCYVDGRLAGTVGFLVDEPPEEPRLSCFLKSAFRNATCEWRPLNPPSPTTKATLFVRLLKTVPAQDFQKPCPYSWESRKFSCLWPIREGQKHYLALSLCIATSAGSKTSNKVAFDSHGILKPDPPINIMVTAVPGHPRWLNVTWEDPDSWNTNFYRLKFQVRYRAAWSKKFTVWIIQKRHHCIISDALQGVRHVLQIRAQEEFGIGKWSDWSPEIMRTPWTDNRSTPAVTPKTSIWDLYEDYYDEARYRNSAKATSLPVQDLSSVSLSTFLVAGGSLAFGLLLCIAIVLRLRKTWKSQAMKERKACASSPCASEQPKPTLALVPLLAAAPAGNAAGSRSFPDAGREPRGPYDISNRDYFFPG